MREDQYHAWFYLNRLGFSNPEIKKILGVDVSNVDKLPPADMARWFANGGSTLPATHANLVHTFVVCLIIGIEIYHHMPR